MKLLRMLGYCGPAGKWTTNMRVLTLALVFAATTVPCLAQTISAQTVSSQTVSSQTVLAQTVLKSEPLWLAPYEVAFVQDASCPAGKVLKITGAIRGLHRKKACVALAAEQASLVEATP
jgi:hypothetical protein